MIRTLITSICLLILCGCTDRLDMREPEIAPAIQILTSRLWVETEESTGSDGTPVAIWRVWSFDDTGNGFHAVTTRNADNDPVEQERTPFQWAFTNQSHAVFSINGEAFAHMRYWLIESLTETGLSVRTAMTDPVINPGTDQTPHHFMAVNK